VADLGEGDRGPGCPPPPILVRKELQKREKLIGQAKNEFPPPLKLKVWIQSTPPP